MTYRSVTPLDRRLGEREPREAKIDVVDNALVIVGTVVAGDKLGRLLGFPTANIDIPDDFPVQDGVWAGLASVASGIYPAAISIGVRPTYYDGRTGDRLIELHILGFTGDLYGVEISASLHRLLRAQRWFGGSAELVRQVQRDIEDVRRWATTLHPETSRALRSDWVSRRPSFEERIKKRNMLRHRRICAAALLAERAGDLTHDTVARLAGVPVGYLKWLHPASSDMAVLARYAPE